LVLASSSLFACGTTTTPPGPSRPATSSALVSAEPSAAPITDCGTFTLSQGERLPESAARCFVDAVQEQRPARLRVTRPTVEGDPIPVTYSTGTDGRTEVLTDSRRDKFGAQVVTRGTCLRPTVDEYGVDFAECSEPTPVAD
jgi:hypothetical protein